MADLGYGVQLIEQSINLKNAQKIKPDVVAVSNKLNHAMVTDCKGGSNVGSEQDKRYRQLESDDLKYYVTTHDEKQLRHTVCYSDMEKNHPNLRRHTNLPFITFGERSIKGEGDFGVDELNQALCKSVSLDGAHEPVSYYPFSPEDDESFIVSYVLCGLISCLSEKGQKKIPSTGQIEPDVILQKIHPFYDTIANEQKKRLVEVIGRIITRCMQEYPNFKEQITKLEQKEFNTGTFRSLQKICGDIAKDVDQKRITEY